MSAKIRKIAVNIEETHREIGREISPATRKAVAVAVIENPNVSLGRTSEPDRRLSKVTATVSAE